MRPTHLYRAALAPDYAHWLVQERWDAREASWLLAGIDPASVPEDGLIDHGVGYHDIEAILADVGAALELQRSWVRLIGDALKTGALAAPEQTPSAFVVWAQSRAPLPAALLDALAAPTQSTTKAAKPAFSFAAADQPFIDRARALIATEKISIQEAARRAVGDGTALQGGGTLDSKITRIAKRIAEPSEKL